MVGDLEPDLGHFPAVRFGVTDHAVNRQVSEVIHLSHRLREDALLTPQFRNHRHIFGANKHVVMHRLLPMAIGTQGTEILPTVVVLHAVHVMHMKSRRVCRKVDAALVAAESRGAPDGCRNFWPIAGIAGRDAHSAKRRRKPLEACTVVVEEISNQERLPDLHSRMRSVAIVFVVDSFQTVDANHERHVEHQLLVARHVLTHNPENARSVVRRDVSLELPTLSHVFQR